ncbi:hypothetical protein FB451DRAFT_1305643, partial [Mycena latifolia]
MRAYIHLLHAYIHLSSLLPHTLALPRLPLPCPPFPFLPLISSRHILGIWAHIPTPPRPSPHPTSHHILHIFPAPTPSLHIHRHPSNHALSFPPPHSLRPEDAVGARTLAMGAPHISSSRTYIYI